MENTQAGSYNAADHFRTLRRLWWILALATSLGIAAAWIFTSKQHKVYTATTSVLVEPTGSQDTNVVGGRTKGDINLDTEAQLVRSTAVAVAAAKLMKTSTKPNDLADRVTVDVPANTAVLAISYTAATPIEAQAGSHAFAEAYLSNRADSAKADLNAQISALDSKIKTTSAALAQVNNRIPLVYPGGSESNNLESQRTNLSIQLTSLSARMNTLTTTIISAGTVISDAKLPTHPTWPDRGLNLASGALLGLLLGGALVLVLQRLDRRVRRSVDVIRRCDISLLAELPARVTRRFDGLFSAHAAGGRAFNRLRNEVVASLEHNDQIVVVSGASRGASSTLVATNLAAALARTGAEVVLVCAHVPDNRVGAAAVPQLLGVDNTPGLSDVLSGRVALTAAMQRAVRNPWLRVVTTGGTASAGGLLQSQALREVLAVLRAQADYIVIEAPSTSASADAQSIASLGDAAILAVELRRTRLVEVADAAEQLRRIGVPLLGAVVLPRLMKARDKRRASPVPTNDVEPSSTDVRAAVAAPTQAVATIPPPAAAQSTTQSPAAGPDTRPQQTDRPPANRPRPSTPPAQAGAKQSKRDRASAVALETKPAEPEGADKEQPVGPTNALTADSQRDDTDQVVARQPDQSARNSRDGDRRAK